ncbi:hypothetical protein I4U23_018559 [Adineta vaga]|nr:hypothetical protein I4U23_018559 [Adineta vaga]
MEIHLFILLFLLSSLTTVSAYRCYSCQFDNCGDPFNENAVKMVNATSDERCYKSKIDGKIIRGAILTKACYLGENACLNLEFTDTNTAGCCCHSDLCNNAQSLRKESLFIFFFLPILLLYYFF